MQGLPEEEYEKLPPERREAFERGSGATIAALDSLGFRFEVPADWK
jgi:hypothetical protein